MTPALAFIAAERWRRTARSPNAGNTVQKANRGAGSPGFSNRATFVVVTESVTETALPPGVTLDCDSEQVGPTGATPQPSAIGLVKLPDCGLTVMV